eukprot:3631830-Alexandrium_andersonii.AAC.1
MRLGTRVQQTPTRGTGKKLGTARVREPAECVPSALTAHQATAKCVHSSVTVSYTHLRAHETSAHL